LEVFGEILANLSGFNLIEPTPKFSVNSCSRYSDYHIRYRMDECYGKSEMGKSEGCWEEGAVSAPLPGEV
jgi:hypothetical protein